MKNYCLNFSGRQRKLHKQWRSLPMVFLVAAMGHLGAYAPAMAKEQSPPGPIIIDQSAKKEVITYLPAGGAERSDTLEVRADPASEQSPKYYWMNGWDTTDEYLSWTVQTQTASDYQLTSLLSAKKGETFRVWVDGVVQLDWTASATGWLRENVGTISLPAGTHKITIRRTSANGSVSVKTFELLETVDIPAYNERAKKVRTNPNEFRDNDYGIMFQFGPWGYPQTGDKKSIDQSAADFDVDAHVEMIKSMNADYVVWSVSWWSYEVWSPIQAIDDILGHSKNTSSRDLIGDVAKAFKDAGIKFYLYYHTGQDTHKGWESTDWWAAQQFPLSFHSDGMADRSVFFNNWESVVREMGERWGENLDGWFFDDGLIYYPAPYERLSAAAKAGNPERTLSFNNWHAPLYTDFQDVSFGEVCRAGNAPVGGDGRYRVGAEIGQLGHCMFHMDWEWGVHGPNQSIYPQKRTTTYLTNQYLNYHGRNVALTLDMMMYEDGSVEPTTKTLLQRVGRTALALKRCDFGCTRVPASETVSKSGGWWSAGGNDTRNLGDFDDNVYVNSDASASLTYEIEGTGVRIIGPTQNGIGNFDIYIDGILRGTAIGSKNSSEYIAQEELFAITGLERGTHTVKLVKRTDGWMAVDYLEVINNQYSINDNAAQIETNGSWAHATRDLGDWDRDVTYTRTNGDSFQYTFNGTGVRVIGPKSYHYGDFEVTLDGVVQPLWSGFDREGYVAQQTLWAIDDLEPGDHTIEVKKVSGDYLAIDRIDVTYGAVQSRLNDDDPAITRSSNWSDNTRQLGDYKNDVAYTLYNGKSFSYTFTGKGIRLYAPLTSQSATDISVTIDGVDYGPVSQHSDGKYIPQVPFFEVTGLADGSHTVTVTKVGGGTYLVLDMIETF